MALSSRTEFLERLLRDGCYVQDPLRSEVERRLFLAVLQSALDHVIGTSPSLLPSLLESLCPRFGQDEGVLLVLGKTFLRREMHTEAEYFLQKVLVEVNAECLLARERLRMLYEMVVPRWHFHMLNDFVRNLSYSQAISKAVARIPDCSVLDIGSGTGLLSMLAVRAGASRVYACEMDATMATMSRDIITTNGMTDRISIINKTSSDLAIPQDIPERVCLVVTETVDAGLLGEAIVKTIRDAWSRLLLPRQPGEPTNQIARCGHVIPYGATMYLMAIECPYIARHSRLVSETIGGLSFGGITLEGSCKGSSGATEGEETGMSNGRGRGVVGERVGRGWRGERGRENGLEREPYTCERLSTINGGYFELSRVYKALSLDFNHPEVPLSSVNLSIPVVRAGCLDAMATYYDLHLDSDVTISTSPHSNQNCCWEQALYPVTTAANGSEGGGGLLVAEGDIVHVQTVCTDTLLHVTVDRIERGNGCPISGSSTGKEDVACSVSGSSTGKEYIGCRISGLSTDNKDVGCPVSEPPTCKDDIGCPISGSTTVHFVDRGALCRLNDAEYHKVYSEAISHALRLLQEDSESESESSDITADPSPIPTGVMAEAEKECEMKSDDESSTEDIAEMIVLDLGHELSILGLMAANIGFSFVHVGRCHDIYKSLLESVARSNGLQEKTSIKWVELESTFEPSLQWDVVLCDIVSPQGILRPSVFEEIGTIRECQSHSDTLILPGRVGVHSAAISSAELRAQATVLGSIPTLGLDIARFINKYQVTHYIDLDLSSLAHDRLTEEIELFSIDLNTLSSAPFREEREVRVEVTRSGTLTGFLYWFSLHFPITGATIHTHHHRQGHWHQAVFCLQEEVPLLSGQTLCLRALLSDSLLDISLSNIQ